MHSTFFLSPESLHDLLPPIRPTLSTEGAPHTTVLESGSKTRGHLLSKSCKIPRGGGDDDVGSEGVGFVTGGSGKVPGRTIFAVA